MSSMITEKNST